MAKMATDAFDAASSFSFIAVYVASKAGWPGRISVFSSSSLVRGAVIGCVEAALNG